MTDKLPKIRFRDREASNIQSNIIAMGEKYIYAEPFPLSDDDIIAMAHDTIPSHIHQHIQDVVDFDRRLIPTRAFMSTKISGANGGVINSELEIYDETANHQFTNTSERILQPTSQFYKEVIGWVDEVAERGKKVSDFTHHTQRVFYHCNTPGQVKTVYPALVELLPYRMHQALKASTRATRWPDGLLRQREEFIESSKDFENMIVLLKMVSSTSPATPRFRTRVK